MSRILAIDPGAERLGWALLEGPVKPEVLDSGILGLHREPKEEFQKYKLRLIKYWANLAPVLFAQTQPDIIVNETLPAVGGGNFIAATQSELAKTAITVIHTWAFYQGLVVAQVGATTVKAKIGGVKNATKAKVRNGVTAFFPELTFELKKESVSSPPVWDRSDAIAIGATYCGLDIKRDIIIQC